MADREAAAGQTHKAIKTTAATIDHQSEAFVRKIHDHTPKSTHQFTRCLTPIISIGILLVLTGLSITATILALIFFTPLIILSSPIWIPVGAVLFVAISGFLSVFGMGVAAAAALSWTYRYMKGFHPPGSDRVDYARSRICDTACHVKDCAMEYGEYFQSKVKDAAPEFLLDRFGSLLNRVL